LCHERVLRCHPRILQNGSHDPGCSGQSLPAGLVRRGVGMGPTQYQPSPDRGPRKRNPCPGWVYGSCEHKIAGHGSAPNITVVIGRTGGPPLPCEIPNPSPDKDVRVNIDLDRLPPGQREAMVVKGRFIRTVGVLEHETGNPIYFSTCSAIDPMAEGNFSTWP